jgi:hypothetical protein
MFHYIAGEGPVKVVELAFLTIVDALRVILAYPLAPTVQNQLSILGYFLIREFRIADEEDVDGEAHVCQCLR